ncbi:MAG: SpoIIE family protein phosphatase [Acidobacteria bacterium]|nr:SpoIIE family protein phosphatase [Acidobacteriota bacterium]
MTGTSKKGLIEVGVNVRILTGETESGDQHLVRPFEGGVLIAVVDGLGHGEEAAAAAKRAIEIIDAHAEESVIPLVNRCHRELVRTRGAVIGLASIRSIDNTMTWMSIGNVEGVLVRADTSVLPRRESIFMRGGVVGYNLPPLRASVVPVSRGDMMILATDGIHQNFIDNLRLGESPQQAADRIAANFARPTDDALVLVARYIGGEP